MTNKQQQLQQTLAEVAGAPVEITFRGEKEFTFSMDGVCTRAVERLAAYFRAAGAKAVEAFADEECEMCGVYVTAA
jgi:hypothetical protein